MSVLQSLVDARDGPQLRAAQRDLVRATGAVDAPFEPLLSAEARERLVAYWAARQPPPPRASDSRRSPGADGRVDPWFRAVVLPHLAGDPRLTHIALTDFADEMAWGRVRGRSLERARRVVRDLLLTDGEALASVLPGGVDSATVRNRALHWAERDPDELLGEAAAASLSLVFPDTAAHDLCFLRTQRFLVRTARDSEAPFYPVPTPAHRDGAAAWWNDRVGRRRGRERRHRVVRAWDQAHGTLLYETLAPLPRDEAEREERVTRFALDVMARDAEDIERIWGVDVVPVQRRMRTELVAPHARRNPRAKFVPLLIQVLPRGDAHWDGWLVLWVVAEIQHTLVCLTGELGAPPVVWNRHRRRMSDFWHAWWAERADRFTLPPEDQRRRACEAWEARTAPLWRRQRALVGIQRALGPVAMLVLTPIGLVTYVVSWEVHRHRGAKRAAWKLLGPLLLLPYGAVWIVGVVGFGLIHVVGGLVWLLLTPWRWGRVWRSWRRRRRWR